MGGRYRISSGSGGPAGSLDDPAVPSVDGDALAGGAFRQVEDGFVSQTGGSASWSSSGWRVSW